MRPVPAAHEDPPGPAPEPDVPAVPGVSKQRQPIPLSRALGHVDRRFGIGRMLADAGRDVVADYYRQASFGYRRVHSPEGAMHMALNRDGRFDPAGYLGQAESIAAEITAIGARRVLELGCGVGFNSLYLARRFPDVSFEGLDLLQPHVAEARRAADGIGNLRFEQGSFESRDSGIEPGFDLVFAVECLCHTRDLDALGQAVAGLLRPGGRLIIFDGYRLPATGALAPGIEAATRLTEVAMAVADGFRPVAAWDAALTGAGLLSLGDEDLRDQVRPTTCRLQALALRFFEGKWKARLARAFLPQHLLRNAVAGLLLPYLIAPEGGSLIYMRRSFKKLAPPT